MVNQISISVIIPMHNAEKTIVQTLKELENQTRKDFQVVIVDDGSTDNSSKLVTNFKNQSELTVKLIHQKNSGPAKARNVGVEQSKGDIIIFLDSDCIPRENWVEEMVRPLSESIVGCTCGYRVKNRESLIARYVDYEIARRHKKLINNIDTIGSYSASFLRSVFIEAGGFDIAYLDANAEDFDLSFKIGRMGYGLRFTDKTSVYHYHPDSLRKYLKQQYSRGYWRVELYLRNKDKIIRGDIYSGYEPQIQFILSSLSFLSIPLSIFNPVFLIFFILLLLSNLPLGLWIFKKEKKFIVIAPILASIRSLAGTFGVYLYFIKRAFK